MAGHTMKHGDMGALSSSSRLFTSTQDQYRWPSGEDTEVAPKCFPEEKKREVMGIIWYSSSCSIMPELTKLDCLKLFLTLQGFIVFNNEKKFINKKRNSALNQQQQIGEQ